MRTVFITDRVMMGFGVRDLWFRDKIQDRVPYPIFRSTPKNICYSFYLDRYPTNMHFAALILSSFSRSHIVIFFSGEYNVNRQSKFSFNVMPHLVPLGILLYA